ncbi:hypothetical protein DGG96_10920 [Legionella qingyii]|uniref:Ran GTPase-activating protein (RanGAP) involved in mRNA processing and transport n=1 Tax=Legionella qingyii TaxID=2184757 RepID=A0A317U1I5_9GAMM|nr:hypothetical protein [Legionella qingyii]PWY55611.1 hypothetical protein DGG96_10920 [Legionella qingyii]RUR21794.1 hypothetical protein ELY20_11250 [Legionella qingyii]RUR25278.1 hypothetical protein ELY16_10100 [Legionella qingyii]
MTIRLKHEHGTLEAIELFQLQHHLALPRLKNYLQSKGSRQCKSIKKISIGHSTLDDKDYSALHDILKLSSKVSEVSFYANHIDTEHLAYLFDSLPNKKLNTIRFVDNWIGEKVPAHFFSFLKKKKLNVLDLSLNWLRDTGVQCLLAALETNTDLYELVLSCNDFSLAGMNAVHHFVLKHPSLKILDISYNNLNEECAKEIAAMITKSQSLTHLIIRSNKIGDVGAEYISQALKSNNNLKYVDLSDNKISGTGLSQLVREAETHDNLEELILKYNHLLPSMLKPNRSDLHVFY